MKVRARYDALVAAGELQPDADQAAAAARLDVLAGELEAQPKRGSTLWRMLGRRMAASRTSRRRSRSGMSGALRPAG